METLPYKIKGCFKSGESYHISGSCTRGESYRISGSCTRGESYRISGSCKRGESYRISGSCKSKRTVFYTQSFLIVLWERYKNETTAFKFIYY